MQKKYSVAQIKRNISRLPTTELLEYKEAYRQKQIHKFAYETAQKELDNRYKKADKLDSASKKRSSRLYRADQKRMKKRRVKRQPRSNNFGLGSLSLGSSNLSRMRFF